jgi:hypothetical protein
MFRFTEPSSGQFLKQSNGTLDVTLLRLKHRKGKAMFKTY